MEKDLEENAATTTRTLWARLKAMEKQRRFGGRKYPEGVSFFPFKLTGQGFFPGGDGLWRDDFALAQASSGTLPVGGVVFLGNDFGTLKSYQKLRPKGFENPPTWRHLKKRICRAGVPQGKAFFTNATLGLRSDPGAKALGKRTWKSERAFSDFCWEFFVFQIELLQPRLLVIMGHETRSTLLAWGVDPASGKIGNHTTALHYATHPFADNFTEKRKADEADALREAWERGAYAVDCDMQC